MNGDKLSFAQVKQRLRSHGTARRRQVTLTMTRRLPLDGGYKARRVIASDDDVDDIEEEDEEDDDDDDDDEDDDDDTDADANATAAANFGGSGVTSSKKTYCHGDEIGEWCMSRFQLPPPPPAAAPAANDNRRSLAWRSRLLGGT